jgi:hypothetical protein
VTELGALWASEGTDLREESADLKVAGIEADGAVAPGTASLQ